MKMVKFQCKCGHTHMVMTDQPMVYVCGACNTHWSLMPGEDSQVVEVAPTATNYFLQNGIPTVHEKEYLAREQMKAGSLKPEALPLQVSSPQEMDSLYTGFLYGLQAAKQMA